MKEEIDPTEQVIKDFIDGLEGKKPMGEATIAGEQELTNEQRSRLPYIMAVYHHCFLCNAEPPPFGMYAWKQDGQTIITPICKACYGQVDTKERIEEVLRLRRQM